MPRSDRRSSVSSALPSALFKAAELPDPKLMSIVKSELSELYTRAASSPSNGRSAGPRWRSGTGIFKALKTHGED